MVVSKNFFIVSVTFLLHSTLPGAFGQRNNVIINRHFLGDIFATSECETNFCNNGGTNNAEKLRGSSDCECQCNSNSSTFREDQNKCVNDLQECTLAEFAISSTGGQEKIPFVFLPLSSGQTIYPTADIKLFQKAELSVDEDSLCVLSSTQLLFSDGWHKLEAIYGHEFYHHPFRVVQQVGAKTSLQWLGDDNFRQILEGKLVLIHLLCQKKTEESSSNRDILRPCVAFRVAGSPGSSIFKSTDINGQREETNRLGASDYIAIGVCVGFLCIVYLVAVVIFFMLKRRRRRKERLRQQFLLPPVTMPPGLGYKSSRILGLEEAFIPELRKIEPIPGMTEENLERLQRRRLALEEERRTRFNEVLKDECVDIHNGLSENDLLEKNKKLFDAHRMFGGSSLPHHDGERMFGGGALTHHDGDGIEKMYVNPNFSPRRLEGVSHLVSELPPLSPGRLKVNPRQRVRDGSERAESKSSNEYDDDDGGYPGPSTVDSARLRNVVTEASSREIHDPMSLDSGVITTLSRSVSPISSSNRGSSGRMDVEEETNVDEDQIANLVSGREDSDRDSEGPNYFDSLRHPNDSKRSVPNPARYLREASQHHSNRFNENSNVSVPFNLKLNDRCDPLAKLYDTAVLKIPKVIPSDSDSLYSDCNTSFTKSRYGDSDLYEKRLRLNPETLVETPEEDLYEVIRSESEDSSNSSSSSSSSNSSICDVYVNKYMTSGQASEMSGTEDDETERGNDFLPSKRPPTSDISSQRLPICDISSMGKMIVTISGSSENKEASVSSGKLLIEVRDERTSRSQTKSGHVQAFEVKKWQKQREQVEHRLDEEDDDEGFDPDTLERGLGSGKHTKFSTGHHIKDSASKCFSESSTSVIYPHELNSPKNPDYSFRLFEKHSEDLPSSLPPLLPPKIRSSSSSVYSSTTPSVCSNMSDISSSEKPQVPPKVKQKKGLTAERKTYFESLSKSNCVTDR